MAVLLLHSFDRNRARGTDSRICLGSYVSVLADSLGVFADYPPAWMHGEPAGSTIRLSDMRQMPQLLAAGDPPRFLPPREIQVVPVAEGEAPEDAPVVAPRHPYEGRQRAPARAAGPSRAPRAVTLPMVHERLERLEQIVGDVRQDQVHIRGMLQSIMDHFHIPPPPVQQPPPQDPPQDQQ